MKFVHDDAYSLGSFFMLYFVLHFMKSLPFYYFISYWGLDHFLFSMPWIFLFVCVQMQEFICSHCNSVFIAKLLFSLRTHRDYIFRRQFPIMSCFFAYHVCRNTNCLFIPAYLFKVICRASIRRKQRYCLALEQRKVCLMSSVINTAFPSSVMLERVLSLSVIKY